VNKEAYIRKSHSFTKESLEHLGILSRYMGDIGESAVLRYLIINEIRKVPAFQGPTRITLTDEDAERLKTLIEDGELGRVTEVYSETEMNHQVELAERGLPSIFSGLGEDKGSNA
jgi:hypothetical protein